MSGKARCRADTCRQPILWALTPSGRMQPLNPDPDPAGLVVVGSYRPDGVAIVARTLSPAEALTSPIPAGQRFTAHHATCPARANFRRSR